MDILAHGLWAWAGGEVLRRRGHLTKRTLAAGVALTLAPDLIQMLPVLAGVLIGQISLGEFLAYATANPDQEPIKVAWVSVSANHLHCVMHSVIIAGVVSLVAWWRWPVILYPLLGWWLHIAIDVPTHSSDYYAVPIFYPISFRGFNGIAWTSPWFIGMNYVALVAAGIWLIRTRSRR